MKSSLKNRSWVATTVLLIGLSGCTATSTRQSVPSQPIGASFAPLNPT